MANILKKIKKIAFQGLSILNGAVGDKLEKTSLGIAMNFYRHAEIVDLSAPGLKKRYGASPSPKICLLIHGLTHNETAWEDKEKSDYGQLLERDLQYTPFYLRYNTGLHISDNGEALASLLERLIRNYPVPVEEICIIAHSMGGLVTHSACHYGQERLLEWPSKVRKIFLLATPHLGSFLEKFANVTTNVLEKVPNWPTRLVGKAINQRSAGIKDLRYGYVKREDWSDGDQDRLLKNNKQPTPKLSGVDYYVIAARLTEDEKHWVSELFGDILVNVDSAASRSFRLNEFEFPPENYWEFPKTNHFDVSAMPEVYDKIRGWISA